jgi:glycerol kinase
MSGRVVIALDLGTTSVRALLVGEEGGVLAQAAQPLRSSFPRPGWLEQDPAQMWEASLDVLTEVLKRGGLGAADVSGIGVVNQRSTTLAWHSETGAPLASAIGWQDQRTRERVAGLRASGIPINTLASSTKFEWWMQNDSAVQAAAAAGTLKFGTPDTWLTYKLTGGEAHVTDPSNASCTALYDAIAGEFSAGLCGLFGVPLEPLPRVVATSEVVAETPAGLLGAPVPVAARAGDQQAAAFAQGVHRPGDAKLTLGTAAMLNVHTGPAMAEIGPGIYPLALWRLADGSEAFCLEGTVITTGSVVEWLVELGLFEDAVAVDRAARDSDPSGGVVFVPALQGLGTPYLDDGACGLILGLTRGSGRGDFARATLEGIAQRCADVVDAIAPESTAVHVDGGLGQSEFLMQALADFSGREVRRAAQTETTALGAAFLAGLAVGTWDSPEACRAIRGPATVFAPGLAAAEREQVRQRWQEAVERARSTTPD